MQGLRNGTEKRLSKLAKAIERIAEWIMGDVTLIV